MTRNTIRFKFFVPRNLCTFLMVMLLICSADRMLRGQSSVTDEDLLSLYEGLRVADVSDGMDRTGLADRNLMDPKMMALWNDMDQFDHIFRGIALTLRYVPTPPNETAVYDPDDFRAWKVISTITGD